MADSKPLTVFKNCRSLCIFIFIHFLIFPLLRSVITPIVSKFSGLSPNQLNKVLNSQVNTKKNLGLSASISPGINTILKCSFLVPQRLTESNGEQGNMRTRAKKGSGWEQRGRIIERDKRKKINTGGSGRDVKFYQAIKVIFMCSKVWELSSIFSKTPYKKCTSFCSSSLK